MLVDEHPDADTGHVESVQEVLNVILQRVILLLVRLLHLDYTLYNQNIRLRYQLIPKYTIKTHTPDTNKLHTSGNQSITPCTIKIYFTLAVIEVADVRSYVRSDATFCCFTLEWR